MGMLPVAFPKCCIWAVRSGEELGLPKARESPLLSQHLLSCHTTLSTSGTAFGLPGFRLSVGKGKMSPENPPADFGGVSMVTGKGFPQQHCPGAPKSLGRGGEQSSGSVQVPEKCIRKGQTQHWQF